MTVESFGYTYPESLDASSELAVERAPTKKGFLGGTFMDIHEERREDGNPFVRRVQ